MSAPDSEPALDRDLFDVGPEVSYLDSAFASPLPRPVVDAIAGAAGDQARRGSTAHGDQDAGVEGLRADLARLLGTDPDRVAVVSSTSTTLGRVAAGLPWRSGDVVVVTEGDHPSTVLPWRLLHGRGVEVREVPVGPTGGASPAELDSALDRAGGRARVVALSWVRAESGWRADLAGAAEVAHAHGALLCVDAVQGLGARPCDLDRWGVDVLASGAQKWTLGPRGIGVLALSPEALDRVTPIAGGHGVAASADTGGAPLPAATARRHEGGGASPVLAAGWRAALELLRQVGVETVAAWTDHLSDRLVDGADRLGLEVRSDRSPAHRSAIVRVRVPGIDDGEVVRHLADAGVVASARDGGVRLSPAGWNQDEDVDAALDALARVLRRRARR